MERKQPVFGVEVDSDYKGQVKGSFFLATEQICVMVMMIVVN